MTNTTPTPPLQVATILWLQNLTKPYNFCELIHFCQGLKRHHILTEDELDTGDLSLVSCHQTHRNTSEMFSIYLSLLLTVHCIGSEIIDILHMTLKVLLPLLLVFNSIRIISSPPIYCIINICSQ